MSKNILVISGSPKKDGNTALLIEWFAQGARAAGAGVEIIRAADLKHKVWAVTPAGFVKKKLRIAVLLRMKSAIVWHVLPRRM